MSLWLVVIGQSSGIAVLQNVHIVEAKTALNARKLAAEREPTTDMANCHVESLAELADGWRYFT